MSQFRKLSPGRIVSGWLVHLFTASGAVCGVLSLEAIAYGRYISAFWLMAAAIAIDAVDGTFARLVNIKEVIASVDGTLLDNIVDFVNYTIVPAFFVMMSDLVFPGIRAIVAAALVLASAYQFSHYDAKTEDHFFRGFPSYWNIVVFYLFLWALPPVVNAGILLVLSALVFLPVKYIYPTRMEYVSPHAAVRGGILAATLLWGAACVGQLIVYPAQQGLLLAYMVGYSTFYIAFSIYRTWVPIQAGGERD